MLYHWLGEEADHWRFQPAVCAGCGRDVAVLEGAADIGGALCDLCAARYFDVQEA